MNRKKPSSDEPLGLAALAFDNPERCVSEILTWATTLAHCHSGVFLACDSSDYRPRFRRVAHVADSGSHVLFLGASTHVDCTLSDLSLTPKIINPKTLGNEWSDLFRGQCLIVPVPGRPLGFVRMGKLVGGVMLLGPVKSTALRHLAVLKTIASIAAICLWQLDHRKAQEGYDRVNLYKLREACESPMEQFASSILELLQMVVSFDTGVIYFGDPDEHSTNMVVAATKGENPKCLLRSYWPDAAKGLTYEAMLDRRPVSGGPDDLPGEARRTNDEALKHVPGELHAAWGLIPFVDENKGVAVAHIEGIRGGLGLARYEWEALNLLGKPVGEIITSWNKKTKKDRTLRPELDWWSKCTSCCYVRPERSAKEPFQALVCRMFMEPPGIQDITRVAPHSVKVDGMLQMDGRKIVLEATLPDRWDHKGGKDKRVEMKEYIEQTNADLGVLVMAGTYNSRALPEPGNFRIVVLDEEKTKRFCCMSAHTRKETLKRWLADDWKGLRMAWFGTDYSG